MKKLFLLIGVVSALVLAGCTHQPTTSKTSPSPTSGMKTETVTPGTEVKESYFLKNNVMMVFRNGQYSNMDNDIALQDGSLLTKAGELKKKDGSVVKLKNNQSVTIDGKILEESMYK